MVIIFCGGAILHLYEHSSIDIKNVSSAKKSKIQISHPAYCGTRNNNNNNNK